jgi:hypothetical protein
MSTGSYTGGEDRGNEPPLATVWRLHVGDEEDSGASTEEWYENERLSGHITGGAPRVVTPLDGAAPAQEDAPAVLDWRHAQAMPPPTARQRLRQALGRRFSRGRALGSDSEEPSARPAQALATGNGGRTRARAPQAVPRGPFVERSDEPSCPAEDRDPLLDRDAETQVEEPRARQDISRRPAEAAPDAVPTISLRGETTFRRPGRAPRRRSAVLALCLAAVAGAVTAPILLSGHSTHHTSVASADMPSVSRRNPLLSTAPHTGPARTAPRKAKVTRTPQHRVKRKLQRSRHHTPPVRRAHSATHAASTGARAPIHTTTSTRTTPVYSAPTPTTPTSTSTPSTGGSSSPTTTSSSGSSSSSGTHPSSSAKQPALGATGTLAPGSSPDG